MTTEQVQLRRGTAADLAAFTPAAGEVVFENTHNALFAGDGSLLGGYPVAGMTLLSVVTISTASTGITDTTTITSKYDDYFFLFSNIIPVSANVNLELQLHSNGSFQNASYVNNAGGATTFIDLIASAANLGNGSVGASFYSHLANVNSTTVSKFMRSVGAYYTGSAVVNINNGGVWVGGFNAIDGFSFFSSSGNIASGKMKLFGIRRV